MGTDLADELVELQRQRRDASLGQTPDRSPRELAVLLDDDFVTDRELAYRTLPRQEVEVDTLGKGIVGTDVDRFRVVEVFENLARVHAQRAEQHAGVHFTAPVDAHVDDVLVVELEVEP